MEFVSELYPGENLDDFASEPAVGRGRSPRDWTIVPYGRLPGASTFSGTLIPRNQWDALIEEKERNKSRLSDLRLRKKIPSLHQGQTEFCWTNAVISAMMIVQAQQGGRIVPLSPASVAAPLTNYTQIPSQQRGFGGKALDYIVNQGVCSQTIWPPNAIDRNLDNAQSMSDSKKHKITDWLEIPSRSFNHLMTLLLRGTPVVMGLNDWMGTGYGHEVCGLDPVKLSGSGNYGVRIWNSYGDSWKNQGMDVLPERYATPDDAVAPGAV